MRHKNDYAAVLLLDERYNRISVKNALPNWIKNSLKICKYDESFNLIKKVKRFLIDCISFIFFSFSFLARNVQHNYIQELNILEFLSFLPFGEMFDFIFKTATGLSFRKRNMSFCFYILNQYIT